VCVFLRLHDATNCPSRRPTITQSVPKSKASTETQRFHTACVSLQLQHVLKKRPPLYILNNSAKNEPVLIIFWCTKSRENFTSDTRPPHLNNIAALYLVKNSSSDAAYRIVHNIHNTVEASEGRGRRCKTTVSKPVTMCVCSESPFLRTSA